ncbi:MAG: Cell division topological specificity factor [Thermoanaerobacterales bacterium 50_218]|nr:MAG: Cell division topological specificity factor [Thermoanaerobacterales bacterium 50_218]HAA90779.1 cell division topological specificity factor MinE [Peptococcaceae bacterium]
MLEILSRIFGKEASQASKNVARERLRLVLMHDRLEISPQIMEALRDDIIKVITNYLVIDEGATEIAFERGKNSMALVASIPVLKMKRIPQKKDTG